ncbi:SpoIIE family protein phosphatase [Luteimicrobium subarcticum]|uniref:Serine phosphatase RsbU (Regulator of sigma subunit) n=1 Tax=Luteimicrobium subarcticum TaxID=620910 RepID=A0A2M8W6T8_9MICO|nr:SpoIIE family protein phosphatase [Luteimicrobium subarcticum]PJI86643.1 serine phosphatase RsbU (regulator of sigma subunit) [Luteimicrobium subarcticum]
MSEHWFHEATRGSAVGAEARDVAWESTPLGPPEGWPAPLRQAVELCYSTRFPVMLVWGPDLTLIYNDGYRDMLGTEKHPASLGASARTVWAEIWDDVGPLFDQVLTTGVPTWTEDMPLFMNRSGFVEETSFTFSYSPLRDDDGIVRGVLDIATETTDRVRALRRMTALEALHAAFAGRVDGLDRLAEALVGALAGSGDLARATVYRVSGDRLEPVAHTADTAVDARGRALLDTALRTGRTAVQEPLLAAALGAGHGRPAIGALLLEGSPTQPFDDAARHFLELVAAVVGTAVAESSARRRLVGELRDEVVASGARADGAEQEAARARAASLALQRAMLTVLPTVDGVTFDALYVPAVHTEDVGGDWYDVLELRDGTTALAVGDVTGHDLHAAAVMGQLRSLLRALLWTFDDPPSVSVRRLDEVSAGTGLGAVATLVVARLGAPDDDGCRRLVWSNAGHPPPMVRRADGTVEVLDDRHGALLGLAWARERRQSETVLRPGDTLVLYTDGLVESRRETILDGFRRLASALSASDAPSPAGLHATLAPSTAEDDDVVVVTVALSAR